MSWREQFLLSFFAHLILGCLIFLVPRLPFIEEARERRSERLQAMAEAAELQANIQPLPQQEDQRPFVFVQPRLERQIEESPVPDAMLSDRDRIAESLLRSFDPDNNLPISEGNSPEFIIGEETNDDVVDPSDLEGFDEAFEDVLEPFDDVETTEFAELSEENTELRESFSEDLLEPGSSELDDSDTGVKLADVLPSETDGDLELFAESDRRIDLSPEGLVGRAVRNLRQRVQKETFRNDSGDTGRYGPDIQFDTKGVEFGPWLRRFVAQIRRNWFVPYAIWSMHGHVVLTFNVHGNGDLTDLEVVQPSHVEAFNNSAFNALLSSNPTQPLPAEYPDDKAFFTVTFYFNEVPPNR
tara:strand:+ start:30364 stop:31428 length:1065 start_codon:yes stop_codon:yes gene_type:complete